MSGLNWKPRYRAEFGASKLGVALLAFLCGSVLFVAYNVLPFYYYYYELLNQMTSLTRVASIHTDQEIRNKLQYHIKKMQIPIDINQIRISRDGNRIQMQAIYSEIFYVTIGDKDYDLYEFDFDAYVDEQIG